MPDFGFPAHPWCCSNSGTDGVRKAAHIRQGRYQQELHVCLLVEPRSHIQDATRRCHPGLLNSKEKEKKDFVEPVYSSQPAQGRIHSLARPLPDYTSM